MAITPQHLAEQHNYDDRMGIDVLNGAEFDFLHIKDSSQPPLPLLSEHTEESAAKMGPRVVVVCRSGMRAEQARMHLNGAGLGSACVLAGGVSACACAGGGDVLKGRNIRARECQVRMSAESLVLAKEARGKMLSPKLGLLAGGIGAGLSFSAATNSCAIGQMLPRMPWNRSANEPTARQALGAKA